MYSRTNSHDCHVRSLNDSTISELSRMRSKTNEFHLMQRADYGQTCVKSGPSGQKKFLHVGYTISFPESQIDAVKEYLGENAFDIIRKNAYFCIHYQEDQATMSSFMGKNKNGQVGYIKGFWKHRERIIAHICVGNRHEYIILSSSIGRARPLQIKTAVNAGDFGREIIVDPAISVMCIAHSTYV